MCVYVSVCVPSKVIIFNYKIFLYSFVNIFPLIYIKFILEKVKRVYRRGYGVDTILRLKRETSKAALRFQR